MTAEIRELFKKNASKTGVVQNTKSCRQKDPQQRNCATQVLYTIWASPEICTCDGRNSSTTQRKRHLWWMCYRTRNPAHKTFLNKATAELKRKNATFRNFIQNIKHSSSDYVIQKAVTLHSVVVKRRIRNTLEAPYQLDRLIQHIRPKEVRREISLLKIEKSSEFVGIPARAIKTCNKFHSPIKLLSSGRVLILLWFMPGKDESALTSYRPISLLSIMGKVFE